MDPKESLQDQNPQDQVKKTSSHTKTPKKYDEREQSMILVQKHQSLIEEKDKDGSENQEPSRLVCSMFAGESSAMTRNLRKYASQCRNSQFASPAEYQREVNSGVDRQSQSEKVLPDLADKNIHQSPKENQEILKIYYEEAKGKIRKANQSSKHPEKIVNAFKSLEKSQLSIINQPLIEQNCLIYDQNQLLKENIQLLERQNQLWGMQSHHFEIPLVKKYSSYEETKINPYLIDTRSFRNEGNVSLKKIQVGVLQGNFIPRYGLLKGFQSQRHELPVSVEEEYVYEISENSDEIYLRITLRNNLQDSWMGTMKFQYQGGSVSSYNDDEISKTIDHIPSQGQGELRLRLKKPRPEECGINSTIWRLLYTDEKGRPNWIGESISFKLDLREVYEER